MSLRTLLLVGMAMVAVTLGVTGVVVVRITERDLVQQVDQQLVAAEGAVRASLHGPGWRGREAPVASDLYVGVLDAGGGVTDLLRPSLAVAEPSLPELDAEVLRDAAVADRPVTVASEDDGLRYRASASPLSPAGDVVVLALPLDGVDAATDRLVAVQLVAVVSVLGLLALVTWWVVRLGVQPLARMTAAASSIAAGDLSARVPETDPGTEAGELGVALNRMLGRIEEAFAERARSEERLRRFVADASHELRTPVATIRGYAELYRAGALGADGALDDAMRRTEQEAVRMGTLVDDLLHLAHLDQGRPLQRQPVDLADVVRDAAGDARAVDPGRPVTATVEGDVVVVGDEPRLRQVVANLVGNALVHTDPGTPVQVAARRRDGVVVVEVADEGPGMSDEVAARAFERFYRADPSRSRHRGGSGLGLAIVAATVHAHDGRVLLETAPGRGTAVRLELPVAPPEDPSGPGPASAPG